MKSLSGILLCAAAAAADLPFPMNGYYSWNWGSGSTGAVGANVGVAFTGLVDVGAAISGYTEGCAWCCPYLLKPKLLSLGGGNAAGMFTAQALSAIQNDISSVTSAGYSGIVFDIEEVIGSSQTMIPIFAKTFADCKAAGLSVTVTVSHSAPY